jgi:hypothetical protein
MSASSQSPAAPSFLRGIAALLLTVLALGGALLGALLLATGALLTLGLRALGIGGRRPAQARPAPQAADAQRVIEGEYRVVEAAETKTP